MATLDARMAVTFEATGLGWMRGQIRGLGEVLLVNVPALSGDPRRFDEASCMVKLTGPNPTERSSGHVEASGGIPRGGRRTLRLVACQAATCLALHNPDFEAFFRHLTQRRHRQLAPRAARVAVANKVLRILWATATAGQNYDSPPVLGARPPPVALGIRSLAVPYWRGLSRRRHRPGVRGVYKWMQQFQYVDHRTLNDVMAWQLP